MKVCRKCGVEKEIEEFPKNLKMADGHLNACKPCEYARVAQWREENPERVRAGNEKTKALIRPPPVGINQECRVCHIEKPLLEFRTSAGMKLGVRKSCKACDLADLARRYAEKSPAERVEWQKRNPERAREIRIAYYGRHKDRRNKERGEYRRKNIESEREREKRYLKNNRPIVYAKNARRRAAETQAVPSWLTAVQKAQIQEFYEIASAKEMQTGEKHHVDHIVPLRGNGVMGLHVPWNLQVLTEFENCSKHNKLLEVRS